MVHRPLSKNFYMEFVNEMLGILDHAYKEGLLVDSKSVYIITEYFESHFVASGYRVRLVKDRPEFTFSLFLALSLNKLYWSIKTFGEVSLKEVVYGKVDSFKRMITSDSIMHHDPGPFDLWCHLVSFNRPNRILKTLQKIQRVF